MPFSKTGVITGAAVTGLTSPTYTLAADTSPTVEGFQSIVTTLGGTQTGVVAHTISSPFTITITRDKKLKTLSNVNPITGQLRNVPVNRHRMLVRKGVLPLANQPSSLEMIDTMFAVPAGSDSYDSASLKASISFYIGYLTANADAIVDLLTKGNSN